MNKKIRVDIDQTFFLSIKMMFILIDIALIESFLTLKYGQITVYRTGN
jgi:hypothetical protein